MLTKTMSRLFTFLSLSSLILVAAALFFAISFTFTSAQIQDVDPNKVKNMPDLDNEEDSLALACASCGASVSLMKKNLEPVKLEFHRQPEKLRSYHWMSAVEKTCDRKELEVGLLIKNGEATRDIIHESELDRKAGESILKGNFVARIFTTECEIMLAYAEEKMEQLMKGKNINLCDSCKRYKKFMDTKKEKERRESDSKYAREQAKKKKNKKKRHADL